MREIKFRGKHYNSDRMLFGNLSVGSDMLGTGNSCYINNVIIDPESIGQYTGLKDKHGKEIYEGDILSDYTETDEGIIQSTMEVFWCGKSGAWKLDNSLNQDKSSGDLLSDELYDFAYEIIGNVNDKY